MNRMGPSTFQNPTRRALLGMCLAVLSAPACAATKTTGAAYGSKVKFSRGVSIAFADFDLAYIGSRHEPSKLFTPGFNFQDFRVSRGKKSTTVSWTAGTGLIVPCAFEFKGTKYLLHLFRENSAGRLKDNELVITRA